MKAKIEAGAENLRGAARAAPEHVQGWLATNAPLIAQFVMCEKGADVRELVEALREVLTYNSEQVHEDAAEVLAAWDADVASDNESHD